MARSIDDDGDDDPDFESDEDTAEAEYDSFDEWLDAYNDGLFDGDDIEEADGGIDYE